jgi:hypothetical protein
VNAPSSNHLLKVLASQLESFEASESVASTGTGTRREGAKFESLMALFWDEVALTLKNDGAISTHLSGPGSRNYVALERDGRILVLPSTNAASMATHIARRWLNLTYKVDDLVAAFPGTAHVVDNFSPNEGPYAGPSYPNMYQNLSTKFDDAILFIENGILKEKKLLEYKTAKSSGGTAIDGNAHERLSFQIMQYLEIATRYPKCSLLVIANGAFARYKNKYHVNFHIQAERLTAFSWFDMKHACESSEYLKVVDSLAYWLFETRA